MENHVSRAMHKGTSEWLLLHSASFYVMSGIVCIMSIALNKIDTEMNWFVVIGFANCGLALLLVRKFETLFRKFADIKKLCLGTVFSLMYWLMGFALFKSEFFWVL